MVARVRARTVHLVRAMPIRWRILAIAALNSAVVLILTALIWSGANVLESSWDDVRQARQTDKILADLEVETSRLQNLIHRYISNPNKEQLGEINQLRGGIHDLLTTRAATDPILVQSVAQLERVTERLLNGFAQLREAQTAIEKVYEQQLLTPAREMSRLYATIESAGRRHDGQLWPVLIRSREVFTAMLVASNAYYLSLSTESAAEARRNTDAIEATIPEMSALAENDAQRQALDSLKDRTNALRNGLNQLADNFSQRSALLHDGIDAVQVEALGVINDLSVKMGQRESEAQTTFERTLKNISRWVIGVATIFLVFITTASVLIALSIRMPLRQLMVAMRAIMSGDLGQKVRGVRATDEIGAMARAVEIFRENAIARRQVEEELRASKERAERAVVDLRAAQQNLINAERLAALGSLVAGVAHEVNNPIGISLTVASSLSRRADAFGGELSAGQPLRKSQLDEFLRLCRDATQQLVANLNRAGELIQSFKQVAVDRSHGEMRQFNLSEATEQIVTSLRPALKQKPVTVTVEVPPVLLVNTYAGAYGQVLTNLFLNAAAHAFRDNQSGHVAIAVHPVGDDVEITFSDDGAGMNEEVLRQAFDPFFTTRRSEGGTGLGLHIVYNIVTQQLGGVITLKSEPGQGTTFRIIMPRTITRRASAAKISQERLEAMR
ncbi:MAG TPA: HAMP domain-containing sensor histidine kinase [Xanthobacteraceae bacterium]|nr:HAMP domain-containing sensor histidine kinase [Xanthobacteraceae bacterium]